MCVCVCVYVCVHALQICGFKKKVHLRVFCAEFVKPAKETATTGYRGLTGCITMLRREVKSWRRQDEQPKQSDTIWTSLS